MKRHKVMALYHNQEGQQLVIVALFMPILIACMALTVDVGNVYVHHRMAQNAADAAASAGASVLVSDGQAAAETTALYYANVNGYNNDGTTNAIQLAFPTNCVRVTITDYVPPILAAVIWNGTFTINVAAGACNMTTPFASSVIVLHPTASEALELTGSSRLATPNGNVHVNSNHSKAVSLTGSAKIVTNSPTTIVGNYHTTGSASISPDPITGVAELPDPLVNLPEPSIASCPSSSKTKITGSDVEELWPGCYKGGIDISGSAHVTFMPGMYLIGGVGLQASGSAQLSASNVTFFLDDGAFKLTGSVSLNLTPPSSGTYNGISIFQSRSNEDGITITGSTALAGVHGTVYAANGDVTLTGSSSMQTNFAVRTLKITGNSHLTATGFETSNWSTTTYILTE